jgi:hypothetical protein
MSSFTIDIFGENDAVNVSSIPTFNHNIGVSSNSLTVRPESSTMSAPDLLPLNNNDERFKQNQLINGKTQYEQDNTIIKSLEEEIVNMKQKLSFVYEKDEEIANLTDETLSLKKQLSETLSYSEEASKLRLENNRLSDDIYSLQTKIKQTYDSNELITNELKNTIKLLETELDKKNKEITNSMTGDKMTGDRMTSDRMTSDKGQINDYSNDIIVDDSIVDDIIVDDELMDINIPHLRNVLIERLKTKQMMHIDSLIDTYGFKRTNKVKKSIMEQMLEEAIRLE